MKTNDFPNDETGQVLSEMQQAGIELDKAHKVVFFQLFENKEHAQKMVQYIDDNFEGISVELKPDEAPNVWDVDCTKEMIPTYDAIMALEAELEEIAERFKGYNDGWGIEA